MFQYVTFCVFDCGQAETELKSLRKQEAAALEKVEAATRKKLAKVEAKLREVEGAARQWESNCQQCEALILQERQRLEEAKKEKVCIRLLGVLDSDAG